MNDPIVLFICTGNYYRSRFAETIFNVWAAESGLRALADSSGLAPTAANPGAIAKSAVAHLERLGITLAEPIRYPKALTEQELRTASRVIALKETEHRPMMVRQFPRYAERIDYWQIHDLDVLTPEEALPQIEQRVRELIVELVGAR